MGRCVGVTRIFEDKVIIECEGKTFHDGAPFRQYIEINGRKSPEFLFKFPVPLVYAWDHSEEKENTSDIHITVETEDEKREAHIRQWARKGHVWWELDLNGYPNTVEMWYDQRWFHGELHKDISVEWNRGEGRERIFAVEADGMHVRSMFRIVKKEHGAPGFFWYKQILPELSEHPGAKYFRELLNPDLPAAGEKITVQEFGYSKWPSDFWVKMWYYNGYLVKTVERISNGEVVEIYWERTVQKKKLSI